jgi:hypothetical protein
VKRQAGKGKGLATMITISFTNFSCQLYASGFQSTKHAASRNGLCPTVIMLLSTPKRSGPLKAAHCSMCAAVSARNL